MIASKKTKLFLFIKNILNGNFTIELTKNQINAILDLFKNFDDYIDESNIFQVEEFTRHLIRLCIFTKI